MLDWMDPLIEAGYNKTMGKVGWRYFDTPWMTAALWAEFVELIGEGNYDVIAGSVRPASGERRGQFMISPEGVKRLEAKSEELEK